MAVVILAWVIDHPVQAIKPDNSYILAITRGNRALPDMHALGQLDIYIRQSSHARVTTIA